MNVKKHTLIFRLVILVCVALLAIAPAAMGEGCEHDWVVDSVVKPTCTKDGYTVYRCSLCGDVTNSDEVPATGHNYVPTETKEPTCTSGGYTVYSCTNCGDSYKGDEVAALDHDYKAGTPVAATCTAEGYTPYTCTRCGDSYKGDVVSALNHDYKAGKPVAATCTAEGYTPYTCTRCGDSYKGDAVKATGHTPNTAVRENEAPATCTVDGIYDEVVYCSVCGAEISRREIAIPATGHAWGKPTYTWSADNATVTAERVCANNAKDVEKKQAAVEKTVVEATTESEGSITYTAKFDNPFETQKKTEVIPKLDPRTFTITFDTDGGNAISPLTYGPGDAVVAPNDPAKQGYRFMGWKPELPATMPESDLSVKAVWEKLYTITFNTDGGSAIEPASYIAGENVVAPQSPTRAGCRYLGWSPALPATMPNQDVEVVAQWLMEIATIPELPAINMTYKPELDAVLPLLPQSVNVVLSDGSAVPAALKWGAESCPNYAQLPEPDFVFTATAIETEDLNPLGDGVAMPTCTLHVEPATSRDGSCVYRLNAANELTIVGWNQNASEVVVPATIDGYPVTFVGAGAFSGKQSLTRLELPIGVRAIGDGAFADCPLLESLALPDTLESVGKDVIRNDGSLKKLVLCTGLDTTLTGGDTLNRVATVIVDGAKKEIPVVVKLPMAVTDIQVTAGNFILDCDFTVGGGNAIAILPGAAMNLAADRTLTNLGAITNEGSAGCNGAIVTCGGAWNGNGVVPLEGGSVVLDHHYESGVCTVCGATLTVKEVEIRYNGGELTKVYDKTRNVSLNSKNFSIIGVDSRHSVKFSKISAAYDSPNVGNRTVTVNFTLGGADAEYYTPRELKLSATITPKPLIITPTAGQKKLFGATDPSYFTGKVKGLLSGDSITGKLSRESGDNVGRYRIVQGTIDAGSNYSVQVLEEYFSVEPKSINSSDIGLVTIGNQRYTGEAITPSITLRFGSTQLVQDVDFKADFSDNTAPGTAKVKLSGIGNYTGTRETTFRIMNVAGGGDGDNSGSYSHNSDYGWGNYGEMEDWDDFFDDDEDSGSVDAWDIDAGHLIVNEVDYGVVLFDDAGKPARFVTFEEELENGDKVLTIVPDPLKDAETGEDLFLEDGVREDYGEQHLRLGTTLIQTLRENGFTEIIYEVEQADLRIPLASLTDEIPLDAEENGVIEAAEALADGDGEPEAEETEFDILPSALQVAAYDICLEQADSLEMTEREQQLLDGDPLMMPAYCVRVRVVPVGGEEPELPVVDEDEDEETALTVELTSEKLPEGCYPEGITLMLLPTEDVVEIPEQAQVIFFTYIEQTGDADLSERTPAGFEVQDEMIYASIPMHADGVYCVSAPEGSLVLGEDDSEEDEEAEDEGGEDLSDEEDLEEDEEDFEDEEDSGDGE